MVRTRSKNQIPACSILGLGFGIRETSLHNPSIMVVQVLVGLGCRNTEPAATFRPTAALRGAVVLRSAIDRLAAANAVDEARNTPRTVVLHVRAPEQTRGVLNLTYIVMAYVVMAYIYMAYRVMACRVMAYIVMTYIVMTYIVMTYIVIIMAYIVMAYIVMACRCSKSSRASRCAAAGARTLRREAVRVARGFRSEGSTTAQSIAAHRQHRHQLVMAYIVMASLPIASTGTN